MTDDTNDDGDDSSLDDFEHYEQTAKDPEGDVPLPPQPGEDIVQPAPESDPANVPSLAERRLEASDYDRQIRPGTPVKDQFGGGWIIVHSKAADTVEEYDQKQDGTKKGLLEYEGNRCMGATERDTVWNCFYLNQNSTMAGGRSGPYGFPESRICRYAYEATDGFKEGRTQDVIRQQVLEQIACASLVTGELDQEQARLLISTAFTPEEADEAMEVAEATVGDL